MCLNSYTDEEGEKMKKYCREELAKMIFEELDAKKESLKKRYDESNENIKYFYIDDLLPVNVVSHIYKSFPPSESMMLKKSLREFKCVAAQMDKYHPDLEEIVYAFQDFRVIQTIEYITGKKDLIPDENLYAGGISVMREGHFLNPHLDNSHDKNVDLWRAFNLLYYVSPNWREGYGGHLELWPDGMSGEPLRIDNKFNRLVIMMTNGESWHSVNPVVVKNTRC